MRKEEIVKSKEIEHVRQERNILALLSDCPFVVKCHGTLQSEEDLIFIMDYLQGGEMVGVIRRKHVPLTPAEARFYLAEVIVALEHIHCKQS